MKKILSILLALMMLLTLSACGSKSGSDDSASAAGKVYYLNFKPEADAAWQDLAKTYTEQTGVEVKVVTAASGEYDTTLVSELGKSNAPTLFNVGNAGAVATYGDYCLDLRGTDVYNEMTTHAFDQVGADGFTYSIANCFESYGIITNTTLLAKAGHSVDEIKNFETLKAVVEDIHARAGELGFDAFTSSGLDSSSSWRFSGHAINQALYYTFKDLGVGTTTGCGEINDSYLDEFRNLWDLYINNSATTPVGQVTATGDAAESEFYTGKAAFYQNGDWEYATLSKYLGDDEMVMLPIYIGVAGEENIALSSGTENCWAVNVNASEADQKATLEFLKWVVTSEEGTTMLAKELGSVPFKSAKASSNVFKTQAGEYVANGKVAVDWAFNATPNTDDWRAGFVSALSAYCADQSDATWAGVTDAYVNGWATQWAAAGK